MSIFPAKMRFDPAIEEELVEAYPIFSRSGRDQIFTDDLILRFLIWLIAPDSPYYDERDWDKRIDGALSELQLSRDSNVYKKFEHGDEGLQDMMFELFRIYGDIRYEAWWSFKYSFHIMTAQMRDVYSLKANERAKYMDLVNQYVSKLMKIELALFNEDHIKDIISERAAAASLMGYAERNAETPLTS